MSAPKRIIRGVKDIRTRSGTPDQVIVPYKAYMAITALEMEKFRRETERDNLILRLNNVNDAAANGRIGKSGPAAALGQGDGRTGLPADDQILPE